MDFLMSSSYDAVLRLGIQALEANVVPDFVLRRATRALLKRRLNSLYKSTGEEQLQALMSFVQSLKEMPIAVNTQSANSQHYEVPTEFYQLVLGKRLKYSSAYFPNTSSSLDEAEEAMMALYSERSQLQDGQEVLDLGCGWGSLSIYLAEHYPNSKITSVSNSETQRAFITEECGKRGLSNVTVITCDINTFNIDKTFDRILSIEMFEHMKNYQKLLRNISSWLKPDGLLFIHIFAHRSAPYHFEDEGEEDWMSRTFFTGGTMGSASLLLYFQDDVSILNQWYVNGKHYAQTSEEWLKKLDRELKTIRPIFAKAYGEADVNKWIANWRTFFIAVAELFGYNNGEEWGVSHYLFKKK
ncbi:unnamed protein product [Sphagnum troendelagicum]|uniref:Coclaurine N-methyltransferase n=1 Tax=Sphagnum troendelagicum TaxID=128251 RepID=A0ABP0UIM3_9BRYO